jgi:hypothetical protein
VPPYFIGKLQVFVNPLIPAQTLESILSSAPTLNLTQKNTTPTLAQV